MRLFQYFENARVSITLFEHQRKAMRKLFPFILVLCILPLLGQRAQAEVRVPSIIGDNMVVQQGRKARVWGTAQGGESVTVTFAGRTERSIADGQGHWQIFLGP